MSRLVVHFDDDPHRLLCKSVEVRAASDGRRLLSVAGAVDVRVTGTRLEFSCLRSAGGFVGGPIALIANAVSRRRMRDGAVDYRALRGVYAQNKTGWTGLEVLRLVADDMQIDLVLPADADAVAVAARVAGRALPPAESGRMTGMELR